MKCAILLGLLLHLTVVGLYSKSLQIADSVIFKIPEGWKYVNSTKETMPGLGVLTSAVMKNVAEESKLTVSVLKVGAPVAGVQYSTELIESTLSPWIEAYRKKGSHYYPRKVLGRGDFVFYSQEVGRLDARKVELRGVLMRKDDDWVNFFYHGPEVITWERYRDWIAGTKLLTTSGE